MSTWVTPKTNWVSTDYFNITDYKRIVGNIEYLKDLANKLFNYETKLNSIPAEKQYTSMIYADEINTIETISLNGNQILPDAQRNVDIDLSLYATPEFRKYYAIVKNLSKFTINVDANTIYYIGVKNAEKIKE